MLSLKIHISEIVIMQEVILSSVYFIEFNSI